MNSVSNSDSEQCPESRLGWVHKVHTLNPSCAHIASALRPGSAQRRVVACALGHIVVPSPIVSRLCPAVSWPCPAMSLRARVHWHAVSQLPLVTIQKLYRDPSPYRAPCHARCCACRSSSALCRKALGAYRSPWGTVS